MLYPLSYGSVDPAGFEPATLKSYVVPSAFATLCLVGSGDEQW